MPSNENAVIDEHTPLLYPSSPTQKTPKKPTPLPHLQIAIVLLLQICEPLTSQSILPYINQVFTTAVKTQRASLIKKKNCHVARRVSGHHWRGSKKSGILRGVDCTLLEFFLAFMPPSG